MEMDFVKRDEKNDTNLLILISEALREHKEEKIKFELILNRIKEHEKNALCPIDDDDDDDDDDIHDLYKYKQAMMTTLKRAKDNKQNLYNAYDYVKRMYCLYK